MQEKNIEIKGINPVELFGVNNAKLKHIKSFFPKLRITARGNVLNIAGDEAEMKAFEKKFNLILLHFHKYNAVSENNIDNLMSAEGLKMISDVDGSEILVHGNGGAKITARTVNQKKLVQEVTEKDMVFAVGPAGTGKTYTAVALAVRALKAKEVKRIVLTRPAVEAGENLGFLPGDLKEKIDPYLRPLYDALDDMIPPDKLKLYIENRTIEIAPLAFMRGRTLDNCFVILDEAQNTTDSQLKMFLTRMGPSAKLIITGDLTQVDLPAKQTTGLIKSTKILDKIKGISIVLLNVDDVVRHRLVKEIIKAYES